MQRIKPRVLPRDVADALATMACSIVQIFFLLVLPSLFVMALLGSPASGMATFLVLYTLFLLFSVRDIVVSEEGIEFSRILGSPKKLDWASVDSVAPVSARELILKGWLWPLFPAREMTVSLTCRGHYRISYGHEFVYFPPRDPAAFEECIPRNVLLRSNPSPQAPQR